MRRLSFLFVFILTGATLHAQDSKPALVPPARAHHAMVYDEVRKKVILVGGSTPLDGGASYKFFSDIWSFDGKHWEKNGEFGDKRSGMTLAWDGSARKIMSYGGFSPANESLGDLRVLNNNGWQLLTNEPVMVATEAGFVYDSERDSFIAFGGSPAPQKASALTSEYNRSYWSKVEGRVGPPGLQSFAMVYDEKRDRTVLFGGMSATGDLTADVWEYDGDTWNLVATAGLAPRHAMGYAYDSKRGRLVIFGGRANAGVLGDTWSWNGKKWEKLADTGPAPRMMGTLAYDKDRDKIVLFGGRTKWPTDVNDTWEFDGTAWAKVPD